MVCDAPTCKNVVLYTVTMWCPRWSFTQLPVEGSVVFLGFIYNYNLQRKVDVMFSHLLVSDSTRGFYSPPQ